MRGPELMLAVSAGSEPDDAISELSAAGWWFEVKWDGIRAVVSRSSDGSVVIHNRRGADITHRYPDVVDDVSENAFSEFFGVVDGEIIVAGPGGVPDFELAHRRDAQSSRSSARRLAASAPATFMPFDLLEVAGADVRAHPYEERRTWLEAGWSGPRSTGSLNGALMWEFVRERGMEGLMAKAPGHLYRPSRQKAWRKIKSTHRVSAIVGAIEPEGGRTGGVGSLQLFLINDSGGMDFIGHVGSGLSERDKVRLSERVGRALVVVEVEYLGVSSSGQLRMPVFKAIRTDVDPATCTVEQLERSGI